MVVKIVGNNIRIILSAEEDNIVYTILVTGDDGNEYNVIPSGQFK